MQGNRPTELGLHIRPAFGTERLIILEELGGVYYVVCYKPRTPGEEKSGKRDVGWTSYAEQIGFSSEFCREGYKVVSEEKISALEAERIFELLPVKSLPEVTRGLCGVDGETVELSWREGQQRRSYSWWMRPPEEWWFFGEIAELLKSHVRVWGMG